MGCSVDTDRRACGVQLVESARIRSQTNGLLRAMDHFNEGIMLVNMGTPTWDIVFVNEAWTQLTGRLSNSSTLFVPESLLGSLELAEDRLLHVKGIKGLYSPLPFGCVLVHLPQI